MKGNLPENKLKTKYQIKYQITKKIPNNKEKQKKLNLINLK
jgi:hypothetical protein